MKSYVRLSLLLIVIVSLSFFLSFRLSQIIKERLASKVQYVTSQSRVLGSVSPGVPVRLVIPAINVNADIVQLGVTVSGAMDVPSNAVDVGWFKLGYRPGEKGSAVVSGHFDGKNGEPAVFTDLHKLKKGDKLFIEDDTGKSIIFIVRESRIYDPGYAEEVFSTNDNAHLNLITCDGVWDGMKKSYSKRLVIFADVIH